MRRNDREIRDLDAIYDILSRCTTINLGIKAEQYPYVIPMTFGCSTEDGKICVYLHCAGEGRKIELLEKDSRVCVEAHIYERVEMTGPKSITAKYESVIGFGEAVPIDDREGKLKAFRIILDHYDSSGFPASSCDGLSRAKVYKVVLDEVSGKRNL